MRAGCDLVKRVREFRDRKQGKTVAKVIEIYVPNNFRKTVKWVPLEKRGKIIEFASQIQKSA